MEIILECGQYVLYLFSLAVYVFYLWCLYAVVMTVTWVYTNMSLIASCLGVTFCLYRALRFLRSRNRYLRRLRVLESPR